MSKKAPKDILNSRICEKNSVRYIHQNKYIIDCVAPTKIYRFSFPIDHESVKKRISEIENEIKKEEREFMKLIEKISDYVNNKSKQKELNELRDQLQEKDNILFLLRENLKNMSNKKDKLVINTNKPSSTVIINKKVKEIQQEEDIQKEVEDIPKEVEDIPKEVATKKKKKISDVMESLDIEKKEDQDEQYDKENEEKDEEYEDIMYNKTTVLSEDENAEIVERN
jgi:hypothetical protein